MFNTVVVLQSILSGLLMEGIFASLEILMTSLNHVKDSSIVRFTLPRLWAAEAETKILISSTPTRAAFSVPFGLGTGA
jgi:hypothetical protein